VSIQPKRVVVIGAGIAGLVSAKVLHHDGFDVTVLEKEPTIGGVWAESRTYPGLRTNNSRDTYAFSDHPYDRSADLFPAADQVRCYLDSYVDRFELAPLIRLSTEVVRVSKSGTGFEVAVRDPDGPSSIPCDFVVVCTGTFCEPDVPEVAGVERFAGTVVHSSQATDPALLAGKRIVVVGAGKSALDCAAWAAEHAERCTLVFRAPHWMAPRILPGGTPIDRLVLGPFAELFFRYHHLTGVERFLHGSGRILPRLFWRVARMLFRGLLRMPTVMIPDQRLPLGIENVGVAPEFYKLARTGRLDLRRDAITAFGDGAEVLLAGGDRLACDVVVLATGWRQALPFLDRELASAVLQDGRFHLYRHILPPTEPRLGFVGYASSTACQLTSEISAHWLSQTFRREHTLPEVREMQAEIQRVHAWLAEVLPVRPHGYFVGPCVTHYIDDLLRDMGVPTRRTRNVFTEYLGAFSPTRYRDVAAQRAKSRAAQAVSGRVASSSLS
jgi:cation diffusion facilitator CzcD-associated flavoprotein CzcO